MEQSKIDRINELARKKKSVGLSEAELEEQASLRKAYIQAFRNDLIQTMNHVSIQDDDGTIRHMKDVTKKKNLQ